MRLFQIISIFCIINQSFASEILKSKLPAKGWYPSEAKLLKQELQHYLQVEGPEQVNFNIILAPHAGYRWSGKVAAQSYKLLKNKDYKTVIILGPSHYSQMKGLVSIPSYKYYETPLGKIPVNQKLREKLLKKSFFISNNDIHTDEHSIQIQLPFLQELLKDFNILPVLCGALTNSDAAEIAATLKPLLNKQTLLVVSSDFTHFGPSFSYVPFRKNLKDNIRTTDLKAFSFIENIDPAGFFNYCRETGITICGRSPILVMLQLLNKKSSVYLRAYNTSGNISNDFSHSVSYISAVFNGLNTIQEGNTMLLAEEEKSYLLNSARETIKEYLNKGIRPADISADQLSSSLREIRGAFVTLHLNGRLRGCIGEIMPYRPLYQAVTHHAVNSAFQDPRFPALSKEEFKDVEIEISALSAPCEVDSYKNIVLGRDGIVLKKSGRSAVFLPQVATEQGWDLETTLNHLSRKAGLSEDGWKEGTSFMVFQAEVFSE